MHTQDLLEVIRYLKQTFPSLERITSYARAKTLAQKTKTLEELKELRKAGRARGVTSEEHILAGRKAKEAHIERAHVHDQETSLN
jgi:hypothetical protein